MSIEMEEKNVVMLKENIMKEIDKLLYDKISDDFKVIFDLDLRNELTKAFIQAMIRTEFELFMQENEKTNYRNGYTTKTIKTMHGEIELQVPRDRNGNFYPSTLIKYNQTTEEVTKSTVKLFQLGLSNRDIVSFLNDVYGVKYSKQTICNMTDIVIDLVDKFNVRKLNKNYIAVYLDATYIPIKFANSFKKQAVNLVVGVDEYGYQEIIAYNIGFRENNELWTNALLDIKDRGVESVDIFITDGFTGINSTIKKIFPNADIQRCTVHVLRNIINNVTAEDINYIKVDFSDLFKLSDTQAFNSRLGELLDKWGKYEEYLSNLFDDECIYTYLLYPDYLHRTIKTTNRVESVNQKIKARIRARQQFQNREALEKILVSSIIQQNNNFDKLVVGVKKYVAEKKDL